MQEGQIDSRLIVDDDSSIAALTSVVEMAGR